MSLRQSPVAAHGFPNRGMKQRCSARTNALTTRTQQTFIDHGLKQVLHLARVDVFNPGAYCLLRQHAAREQRAR